MVVDTMAHRRFLVTGASRGIGRAIADALGADGHDVVGLARHPDGSFPGELRQVDLADAAALEAALAGLAEEHFYGLVNNVGSSLLGVRFGELHHPANNIRRWRRQYRQARVVKINRA